MKRLLLLVALSFFCLSISAQTNTWTGSADNNWSNSANWSLNAVPTASHDVVIPTGKTVNLNVAGTTRSIVVQGNSTFNMNNSLSLTNASNFGSNTSVIWSNGTLTGGGALTNQGVMNLTTTGIKQIGGDITLNNAGTLNITSSGDLWIVQGIVNNQSSGIIDIQADSGDITWSGGNSHILNNTGTIKKTISGGEAQIVVLLNNNDGVISVESGTLSFQNTIGKNLVDGTYNVSAGATLDWDGTVTVLGTLSGTINGTLNWNDNVYVESGTTATFDFSGSGNFNWTNGFLRGGGTLTNLGILNLTTTGIKQVVEDTTLNNEGTVNITSSGDLWIVQGIVNNQSSGVIDIQADSGDITWSGGNSHILNNSGTIKKTISGGEAQIVVLLNNNDGVISVESGTLSFQNTIGKNLVDGTYNVSAGATLDWDGTVTVLGTLSGTINGTLNWNDNVYVESGTTATFDFSGSGNFNWTNGFLRGGGTLTNLGILNLTTTGIKQVVEDTTLNNEGTVNITSSGDLWIVQGIVNNQSSGVIDIQADSGDITWSGGNSHILNNSGTIKKTNSEGEAQIVVLLNNNNGTISVEKGTLSFQNVIGKNLTNGTYNVSVGAIFDWDGIINVSGMLSGSINGELNWNNEVSVTTMANFDFSGSGNFNWTNGFLRGGGTLMNQGILNLTTTGIKQIIENTTLNNEGTINMSATGDLWIVQGVLNNMADGVFDLQVDEGNITFSGGNSHIFNNFGLIKKSAGTGSNSFFTTTTNSGTIDAQSGTIDFRDGYNFTNAVDGVIMGIATVDIPATATYTNDGTFAPGGSPGTLTVVGDFKSSSTSVLDVELLGLAPITGHDVLAITGNAVFNGSVSLSLGFAPIVGNEFVIATTTGTISQCNLQSTVSGLFDGSIYSFDVVCRNNNKVVLTVNNITLGIGDAILSGISYYPNPSNGEFTIDLGKEYASVNMEISNMLGQLIRSEKHGSVSKMKTNIEGASGIYIIKVSTAEGLSNTFKIFKN